MRRITLALILICISASPSGAWPVHGSAASPVVISGIYSGTPTASAATITWTNAPAALGQVCYGLTTGYGTCTTRDASAVTSDTASLSGLSASTTYHYQINATAPAHIQGFSSDQTFTTASAAGSCGTYVADPTNDGCAGAPSALMTDPTPFTTWQSSSQTFVATPGYSYTSSSHPPPFNIAGMDYPVGQITATASMGDPATASISGCTYYSFTAGATKPGGITDAIMTGVNSSGTAGFPAMLYCKASSADITITQLNFGAVGGHKCTILYLSEASTHNFTVHDNYFEATAECTNYLTGGGDGSPTMIGTTVHPLSNNLTFTNNTLIGHAYDPCCEYAGSGASSLGSPPYPNTAIYSLAFQTTGTLTDQYNWYQEIPGQPCAQGDGTAVHSWSYLRDFQVSVAQGHGEMCDTGLMTSQTWQHNTFIFSTKNGAVLDAVINLGNANAGVTTGTSIVNGNVAIINSVGGVGSGNVNLFPNSTMSATAGVITLLTGNTAQVGANMNGGANFAGMSLHALLGAGSGSTYGPGATFSFDCGVSINSVVCPGSQSSGYLGTGPLGATVTGGTLSGTTETLTYTPSTVKFAATQVVPITSISPSDWNIASATITSATAGSITFTNAGASSPSYTSGGAIGGGTFDSVSGGQVNNSVAADFIDLGHGTFTNTTITNNYMDLSQIIGGTTGTCTGGNSVCYNAYVQRGADVTCTNPTTFSGNINMNNGAAVNQWSNTDHGNCN